MPDFISRDITENIEEGIILLDTSFKVIFSNRAAHALVNARQGEEVRWLDIVVEKHAVRREFSGLLNSDTASARIRVNIRQRGDGSAKIPVDLKVKKVIDSFKDLSGFLIIMSLVKEPGHLRTRHGITSRELDVIRQLATGKTNREIGVILGMTVRTVETHITSIFAKIGIKNRTELMSVLSGYEGFKGQE